jgi:hypothetical protein
VNPFLRDVQDDDPGRRRILALIRTRQRTSPGSSSPPMRASLLAQDQWMLQTSRGRPYAEIGAPTRQIALATANALRTIQR